MKACACCLTKVADKKNTHYLTDKIIRSCLNLDGSNQRETGFYFDISNYQPSIEFNFQRETSVDKMEKIIGRKPTDEEIDKAKIPPFSVDNVFCSDCEKKFTAIENPFIDKILPEFRDTHIPKKHEIIFEKHIALIRLFFYLQIWRTAVCVDSFIIPSSDLEILRDFILTGDIENSKINQFPITITYLETLGGEDKYTYNQVGYSGDKEDLKIIFMNDFVIQWHPSKKIQFVDFYGLNDISTYVRYSNMEENMLIVKCLNDSARKKFFIDIHTEESAKRKKEFYSERFTELYNKSFGYNPSKSIVSGYIKEIFGGDRGVLMLSQEKIKEITINYILRFLQ